MFKFIYIFILVASYTGNIGLCLRVCVKSIFVYSSTLGHTCAFKRHSTQHHSYRKQDYPVGAMCVCAYVCVKDGDRCVLWLESFIQSRFMKAERTGLTRWPTHTLHHYNKQLIHSHIHTHIQSSANRQTETMTENKDKFSSVWLSRPCYKTIKVHVDSVGMSKIYCWIDNS